MLGKINIDYADYLQSTNLIFLIQKKFYKVVDEVKLVSFNTDINHSAYFDGIIYRNFLPNSLFPKNNYSPVINYIFNKLFHSKLALKKNNKIYFLFSGLEQIISPDMVFIKEIQEVDIEEFNNDYFLVSFDELDNFSPTIVEFTSDNTLKIYERGNFISKELLQSKLPESIHVS